MIITKRLYTKEGKELGAVPLDAYPRPQLKRDNWQCLNGTWTLREKNGNERKILVPFCPESLLSGYKKKIKYGNGLIYKRAFELNEELKNKRIILHFGAVSNICEVFINRKSICRHENAYIAFEADITEFLKEGENILEVIVINKLDNVLPSGKQKIKRGGMWYTPVTGIWQSVWLESVPDRYIKKIKIDVDLDGADILVSFNKSLNSKYVNDKAAKDKNIDGVIICEGKEYPIKNGKARIEPDNIRLWSPENPALYDFTIISGEDKVSSYFALRTISVKKVDNIPRLCLNGKPYFFNGLLDQGYFSDGIYTPASLSLFEKDIKIAKKLGFNTLRKHIKVEPEQFYYDCDRLGMVVFQDMVNNGGYSFLRDTFFPTIGISRKDDHNKHKNPDRRREFLKGMKYTVDQLYNHPCICYWTIFNEGWGQFCADEAYYKLKAYDKSRIIDATSGWFMQKKSDVESLHVYFDKLHLGTRSNLPLVVSEFGGYVYKIRKHSFNLTETYGYRIFYRRKDYKKAVKRLYYKEVYPLIEKGLCAAIYTQLSDVEDETNGILTYDRKKCRLRPEDIGSYEAYLQDSKA